MKGDMNVSSNIQVLLILMIGISSATTTHGFSTSITAAFHHNHRSSSTTSITSSSTTGGSSTRSSSSATTNNSNNNLLHKTTTNRCGILMARVGGWSDHFVPYSSSSSSSSLLVGGSRRRSCYNSIPRGGGGGGSSIAMTSDANDVSDNDYDTDDDSDNYDVSSSDDEDEYDDDATTTDDDDDDETTTINKLQSSSYSQNDEDPSIAVEIDIITDSNGTYAASAASAKPMSNYIEPVGMDPDVLAQQNQSYMVSAALFVALGLDAVLNKKKRLLLFPATAVAKLVGDLVGESVVESVVGAAGTAAAAVVEGVATTAATTTATTAAVTATSLTSGITNVLPTANLVSGFLLSAGLSLLLSQKSPTTPTLNDDDRVVELQRTINIRKRLHLLLATFSLATLGANLNPFAKAPFLGGGCVVINIHNILVASNGWIKETVAAKGMTSSSSSSSSTTTTDNKNTGGNPNLPMELIKGIKSHFGSLVGVSPVDVTAKQKALQFLSPGLMISSMVYVVASQILFLRALGVMAGVLVPHYYGRFFVKGALASASVEQLQLIGLEWASFARLITASGVFLTLKEEAAVGRMGSFMTRSLNGIVALCALAIAIPPLVLKTGDVLPLRRLLAVITICGYNAMMRRRNNVM